MLNKNDRVLDLIMFISSDLISFSNLTFDNYFIQSTKKTNINEYGDYLYEVFNIEKLNLDYFKSDIQFSDLSTKDKERISKFLIRKFKKEIIISNEFVNYIVIELSKIYFNFQEINNQVFISYFNSFYKNFYEVFEKKINKDLIEIKKIKDSIVFIDDLLKDDFIIHKEIFFKERYFNSINKNIIVEFEFDSSELKLDLIETLSIQLSKLKDYNCFEIYINTISHSELKRLCNFYTYKLFLHIVKNKNDDLNNLTNFRDNKMLYTNLHNKISEENVKSNLEKLWFKVGILFANGEYYKFRDNHKRIGYNKIAINFGNRSYESYFKSTIQDYINKDNVAKNIYRDENKMTQIYNYCTSNNIEMCEPFLAKYNALKIGT